MTVGKSTEICTELATAIYNLYISPAAPSEINIDSATRRDITENLGEFFYIKVALPADW